MSPPPEDPSKSTTGEPFQHITVEERQIGSVTSSDNIENTSVTTDVPSNVHGVETDPKTALDRGLQARHIAMIAIGGAIGTGLLVGTGKALAEDGPAPLVIAYTLIGVLVYVVMTALGEMAAWLPMSAGFAGYASRYCDPCLGFALGWTYWCKYLVVFPNQLVAGAMVMRYWVSPDDVNPAVFITVCLVTIIAINFFGVRFFGEFEYWLSSFKIIAIVALMLVALVISVGGGPDHKPRGFKYWQDPGSFRIAPDFQDTPSLGRFVAIWSAMTTACFAYLGTELLGVTCAEAQNPRKTIPRAIRLTFYRILFFYCVSIFLLSLCVPYDSEYLLFQQDSTEKGRSPSPFIVAAQMASIKVLPDFANACVVVFVFSAANADLYIASRTLYGLAANGHAPKIFKRTDARGLPFVALGTSSLFGLLAYTCISKDSKVVFDYFVSVVIVFGLLTWISLLITHISFVRARRIQGVRDADMPYVAPGGLWGSCVALFFCCVILLTKSVMSSTKGKTDTGGLVAGYIGIPIYLGCIVFWKCFVGSRRVPSREADLYSGKDVIDGEERVFLERKVHSREDNILKISAGIYDKGLAWLF